MITNQTLALLFAIATLLLPMIAAAFWGGFFRGSSTHGRCDAENKTEAIEKLLREEKSK